MYTHDHDKKLKSIIDDLVFQYKEKERSVQDMKFRSMSDFEYILNYFFTARPIHYPYLYCIVYTLNVLLSKTKKMCPSMSEEDIGLVLDNTYMKHGIAPYIEEKLIGPEINLEKEDSLAYFEQRIVKSLYRFVVRFLLYNLVQRSIFMSEKEQVYEENYLLNELHHWGNVDFGLAKRRELLLKSSNVEPDDFFDSYVSAIAKQIELVMYYPWTLLRASKGIEPAEIEDMPMFNRLAHVVTPFESWLKQAEFKEMKQGKGR